MKYQKKLISKEELQKRHDKIKDYIILSNTRLNFQEQINILFLERNRVVLTNQTFFSTVVRDMNSALLIQIRALCEKRSDTHNLHTFVKLVREWAKQEEEKVNFNYENVENILKEISELLKHNVSKQVTIIASYDHAHKNLKRPAQPLTLTFGQIRDYLENIGNLMNKLSGELWSLDTKMNIVGDDKLADNFRLLDLNEAVYDEVEKQDYGNQIINTAQEVINKRKIKALLGQKDKRRV